ncbi:glycosyltransferase [Clostridium sp. YIM B02500]|uniref:glycosyltransferase n=1 Tax=Clostridium sp. YIM B02500 TaxID=2910681 RepID=UPI001EEDD36D|nr:glycosyltransferase [Clostridium sp. YIM B02500]
MEISICMMVKDEEKNIRRCLNSLKPILKNIDSELVIVDTGSKDKTVEISREYTDKIYFHEWENDFSGMRNKTINYANGNWIFIIDADEEITNCNNIIRFLKSSTNSKFQTGLLNVKNMQNLSDDSQYAMLKSPRLFRNDGEFHYEGIVHNNPIFKQPSIDLETTIVHYGYIEENEDVLNKKFIRTSNLLKSALDKDPKNIYYLFQLSVTYTSHNDYFKGYEIIKNAYELLKECKNKSKYKYVYYQMALCSLKLEEDEIAKSVCEEGLDIDGEYIDLIFYLGKAKGLLGEYEGCIQAYQKYIDLCDNYNNMNINFDLSLGMYTLGQKDEALQDIVKIYFKIGKYNEVLNYASLIEKDKYIENIIELVIKGAISSKNINYLKNFYEEKIMRGDLRVNKFFLILEEYCDNDIHRLFSSYNNDNSKLYLLRYKYNIEDSSLEEFIDNISFEDDFNILENYFGDVLYYKFKHCSSLCNLLENVWDKNIDRHLEYISKKYEDFSDVVVKYINNIKDDMNYGNFRINKILCRYVLLINKIEDFEYEWIFKYYLDIGTKLITYIYNEEFIKEEYINALKNEEEKFFVYINIAMKNSEDDRTYINYLRKSLEVYPYMKKGIEILLREFKEGIEKVSGNNEFENYKLKVKENINKLISGGNLEEAEEAINEYKKIVKKDTEICSMKAIIYIMNGRLDNAERVLKEGLLIDSQSKDLLYNLSYIMSKKNNNTKAVELYSRAKLFNGDSSIKVDDIISDFNPINQSKLKVIHGTMEIANQAYTMTEGLKKLGIESKTLNYYPNYLGYKSDYILDVNSFKDINEANIETKIIASKMIAENDVFHFYFGTSLTLDYSDLPLLKELGKKVIMQYVGSDVRMYSKAIKLNKYVNVKKNEDQIKRKLELISRYVPDCLVDYELAEYVKDYHTNIHYIRATINLNEYKLIQETHNLKLKIVHAPTSPEFKGTKYILKAIEELKEKYDFDFELVQGTSHEQATKIYEKADLIIDQILAGSYGLFAVESMAMGKPVICWISDFMREEYPKELPIISANPDTIKEKIEYAINNKDMLKEIGIKGRMYAEKYHDINKISRNMIKIYERI